MAAGLRENSVTALTSASSSITTGGVYNIIQQRGGYDERQST